MWILRLFGYSHIGNAGLYTSTLKGDEMDRERMRPYVGQRIKAAGIFQKTDRWRDRDVDIRRACIQDVEIDGEVVAQHVWIRGASHWERFVARCGSRVGFTALVVAYRSTTTGKDNFCLEAASDPTFLHLPVLKIPSSYRAPSSSDRGGCSDVVKLSERLPVQVVDEHLLKEVIKFVDLCGGDKQSALRAAKAAAAVSLPPVELVRFLELQCVGVSYG